MNKLIIAFIFASSQAFAGLPPTTSSGQRDSSKQTTFNYVVPDFQKTNIGGVNALLETGNLNMASNPSFEAATYDSGYTMATGCAADTSLFVPPGLQSAGCTLSAFSGTIIDKTVTFTSDMTGVNMEYGWWLRATTGTTEYCLRRSGADVTCVDIPGDSAWHYAYLTYPGYSTGSVTMRWRTKSSSTGTYNADQTYFGVLKSGTQVSQATLFSKAVWTSTANCEWSTASTVLDNYGADADCPDPIINGNGSAPGTKIPGILFSSLPAGNYLIIAQGSFQRIGSVDTGYTYRFTDGTNFTDSQQGYNGTANLGLMNISGTLVVPNSLSSATIQVQGQAGNSSNTTRINVTSSRFTISVYRFPTSSQIAVTPGDTLDTLGTVFYVPTATCPQGSIIADGSTISTTYPALAARLGTSTVPDLRGIFVRGAGTRGTAIGGITYSGTLGTAQGDQMQGHYHGPYPGDSSTLSVVGAGSVGTTTGAFNFTGRGSTGSPISDGSNGTPRTGSETRPANMALTPCISTVSVQAPLLVNSVVSSSLGVEVTNRIKVGGASATTNCTSSPCTIYSQSFSGATVTRSGAGSYQIVVPSGVWSSSPSCTCSAVDSSSSTVRGCTAIGATSTAVNITTSYVSNTSNGATTGTDAYFDVLCQGPK